MPHVHPQPHTPHDLYATATTFLDLGMPKHALPYLLTLSQQFPSAPDIHAAIAVAHYNNHEYPHALSAIQRAITLDSTNHHFYIFLGFTHILSSSIQQAHQAFTTALQLHPRDIDASIGLGEILSHLGRPAEAATLLEPLSLTLSTHTSSSQRLRLTLTLCRAYLLLKRSADICTLASDPLLPEHSTLLLYRGIAESLEHRPHEALPFLTRANVLAPNSPRILQPLGIAQWMTRRLFQASRTLTTALTILDHTDDPQRSTLSAILTELAGECIDAAMQIGAGGALTEHLAFYPPPLDHSTTDPDRFIAYVDTVTNMPGALCRALFEHSPDALTLYETGLTAFDTDQYDVALHHFRDAFRLLGDDPVICRALILAFDMLDAPADADAAYVKFKALQNHPRSQALTAYWNAIHAFNPLNMDIIVRGLHTLETLDPVLALRIRGKIDALSHPDYSYDPHDE